jgi:hypothetical protein
MMKVRPVDSWKPGAGRPECLSGFAEADADGPGKVGLRFAVADFTVDGLAGKVNGDGGGDGPRDVGVELKTAGGDFFDPGVDAFFATFEMGVHDGGRAFVAELAAAFFAERGAAGGFGPHDAYVHYAYRRARLDFDWLFQRRRVGGRRADEGVRLPHDS